MIHLNSRDIMTNSPLGKRQLKEVLGSIFAGVIIIPQDIWLVTAWLTDFDVLDNRSGNWSYLNPQWGSRMITFLELLETAVISGCKLNLVVKDNDINDSSIHRLKTNLREEIGFRMKLSPNLHIKGLLTESCFLQGSMNFTYSGANRNEELVTLTADPHSLSNTRIDFKKSYPFDCSKITKPITSETSISKPSLNDEEEDEHDFF